MMVAVLGGLLYYFRRQNRLWLPQLDTPSPEVLHHLHTLVRSRGWMICYLWGLLTLSLILHDIQRTIRPAEAPLVPPTPTIHALPNTPSAPAAVSEVQREIEIDKIKTYFEDAYVSYYYLHKCGVARESDNARLYHALLRSLSTYQASDVAPQIMNAARGSFEVMYSRIRCDAETVQPVQQRFDRFITSFQNAPSNGTP
jgi:hypothetical protein